jgi:hypothetical protein
MKDIGINIGSALFGSASFLLFKNLAAFAWWEIVLIAFFVLCLVIGGGIMGMFIHESVKRIYNKWTGRKRLMKPHSLGRLHSLGHGL